VTAMRELFAELTALIEDVHGVAVEGQATGLSLDIHNVLARAVDDGLDRASEAVRSILARLPAE
jgi:hypothetical protein